MNSVDRQQLAEDRAALRDHRAPYAPGYIESLPDEHHLKVENNRLFNRVLEDHASLYGNEAGRQVGGAIRDFLNSSSMDRDTLRDRLIGILGDGEMLVHFDILRKPLH